MIRACLFKEHISHRSCTLTEAGKGAMIGDTGVSLECVHISTEVMFLFCFSDCLLDGISISILRVLNVLP